MKLRYAPVIPTTRNMNNLNKYPLYKPVWSGVLGIDNTMGIVQILFVLLTLLAVSSQKPFIFEDNIEICSYPSKKKSEKIETTSITWSFKDDQIEINYKLCGKFTDKNCCPVGTSACLKNHKTGEKLSLGTEFALDENYDFKSIHGDACSEFKKYSIVVSLQCSEHMKADAYLKYIEDKCTYHVVMRDPKCSPKCTTYINGNFIDLRDLKRSFSVSTAERNFSVTLCEKNPLCGGDDVNACEIIEDIKTPISLASSLTLSYIGQRNQLSFHGATYKGENKKIDRRFELLLKCDWDKKDIKNGDLKYVKKQTQGRKYTFQLETSFGCIKKPVPCVVHDQFLIYNLSGLYNEHQQMWSTNDGSGNSSSKYFLQVCSPVEFAGKNTSCKSTYAQVCENRNGIDINRGSVLRHLEVDNDVLKARIESGMQCEKNPDIQYQTIIDFYCEEHEEGPKFLKQTNCDTYFTWKTPHACPYYDLSSCSHVHKHYHSCSFSNGNKLYNLSELIETQKSIKDGNKEFLLNICGPVIDAEAPCMRDVSVALKNLTEFNLKHKILSLGKFSDSSVENGSLVLKYATGSFCDGTDYKSKIRFECSSLQEEPAIVKQEKCYYEFLWRTKYACPISKIEEIHRDVKNCTYFDNYSNKSIDFGRIDKTSIQLNDGNKYNYTFDICRNNYLNCTYNGDDCQYLSIERVVVETLHNFTSLEFTLPVECQTVDDFNKVKFRLICEEVKNNDHIAILDIVNCSLVINLFTNFACSLKYDYIPVRHVELPYPPVFQKIGNLTQPKPDPMEKTMKCFSKSPFTNLELNINNLTLTNDFFKKKCPTVTFNDTFGVVKLLYVTLDTCRPDPTKNLSYEVYLKCTNEKLFPVVNDECLKHYNYEELEYCNFFRPSSQYLTSSAGSLIGLIVGILLIIAVMASIVIFIIMKKNICRKNQYGFLNVYQRDTEL